MEEEFSTLLRMARLGDVSWWRAGSLTAGLHEALTVYVKY
jgi:hypothetical protein